MIKITVQTTTPDGGTVERTRVFHNDEQAETYRRDCMKAGRQIIKEERL